MRIRSIWISKYKNIKNLRLKFNEDHLITLLIGQNGLGKSNLIEILALVFRDLDLIGKKEEFESWAYDPLHFEYEIQYECHSNNLMIRCLEGIFQVFIKKSNQYEELSFETFKRHRKERYLPNYIIGYYSGENKRVRDIIKVHEKIEFDFLRSWQRKKKKYVEQGIRRLFFTESSHSQLLLLTLAVYQNVPEFKKPIQQLLKKYLRVSKITEFTIRFKNPSWYRATSRNDGIEYLISNLVFSNKPKTVENPFWGLMGKIELMLKDLYDLQIEKKEPLMYPEKVGSRNIEIIEFDKIDLIKFAKESRKHFPHPIDFFYALEACAIIDSLKSIKIKIKKIGQKQEFEYEQMSEGEQQLLTVLGLILITGKDDCLLLLDEPDTHLNPKWQRDYVELLKEFDISGGRSHMIVATHSPLIVQSSKDADLVLFKLNENGNIHAVVSELQFHTWRIDHVLTSPYFGLESARPKDELLDSFMKKRKEIMAKKKLTKEDQKSLTAYTKDFALFPTGETFSDLQAMSIVHSIADKNDKD